MNKEIQALEAFNCWEEDERPKNVEGLTSSSMRRRNEIIKEISRNTKPAWLCAVMRKSK